MEGSGQKINEKYSAAYSMNYVAELEKQQFHRFHCEPISRSLFRTLAVSLLRRKMLLFGRFATTPD